MQYAYQTPGPQGTLRVARPELADQLRSISEGHDVIFYRPITDGIEILHIIHDARDIDTSVT